MIWLLYTPLIEETRILSERRDLGEALTLEIARLLWPGAVAYVARTSTGIFMEIIPASENL